jgi:hypothetical protein
MCRYVLGKKSYLTITITGNAPLGHSHLCHPFIYGSPVFPLLSRTAGSIFDPILRIKVITAFPLFDFATSLC